MFEYTASQKSKVSPMTWVISMVVGMFAMATAIGTNWAVIVR